MICVEPAGAVRAQESGARSRASCSSAARRIPHTRWIQTVLFHPSFPVDIRHNAKIFREKLADLGIKEAVMSAAELGEVLVTGGGGFLGTALIKLVLERGLRGPELGPATVPASRRTWGRANTG